MSEITRQLTCSRKTWGLVSRLKEEILSPDHGNVILKGLLLLDFVLKQQKEGTEFYLKRKGSEIEPLEIKLISDTQVEQWTPTTF